MTNHSFYDSASVAAGFLREEVTAGERRLVRTLAARKGRLLDVGCGSGRLHDHLCGAHELVGVDYASAQLSLYRAKHCRARLVLADASRLPFRDDVFDSVLLGYHMVESILPLEARRIALTESARVLRPGGRLCLTRHVRRHYRRRHQVADFITGRVDNFGDLRGRGVNRAGAVPLSGFTMHLLSENEMHTLALAAHVTLDATWDFDTGGARQWSSRAVVETYRKQ